MMKSLTVHEDHLVTGHRKSYQDYDTVGVDLQQSGFHRPMESHNQRHHSLKFQNVLKDYDLLVEIKRKYG